MVLPRLGGDLCIRATVGIAGLNVGLLLHEVEVFMQAIQQKGHQLLRVLLLVATEAWILLSNKPDDTDGNTSASEAMREAVMG